MAINPWRFGQKQSKISNDILQILNIFVDFRLVLTKVTGIELKYKVDIQGVLIFGELWYW